MSDTKGVAGSQLGARGHSAGQSGLCHHAAGQRGTVFKTRADLPVVLCSATTLLARNGTRLSVFAGLPPL